MPSGRKSGINIQVPLLADILPEIPAFGNGEAPNDGEPVSRWPMLLDLTHYPSGFHQSLAASCPLNIPM